MKTKYWVGKRRNRKEKERQSDRKWKQRVDRLDIEKRMVHFKRIDERRLGQGIYLCKL